MAAQRERAAGVEDLDSITKIYIESNVAGPNYTWRFPYLREHYDDHWNFYRWFFGSCIENTQDWLLRVVELEATPAPPSAQSSRVIAFALWNLPQSKDAAPTSRPVYDGPRRDADPVRTKAFQETIASIVDKYFEGVYGRRLLGLVLLATLPVYQNQGAGRRLVRWGFQYASDNELPVTVISTEVNLKRYEHWGFALLGDQVLRSEEGDSFELLCYALIRKPS